MRLRRCGKCLGCQAGDCRKCAKCLDMVRYGGVGKLKQSCSLRNCSSRRGDYKTGEMQKVMQSELEKEQETDRYEKQNEDHHNTKHQVVQAERHTNQNVLNIDVEAGEIDISAYELVNEDLETGEIVDLDEETYVLLLQKQEENKV